MTNEQLDILIEALQGMRKHLIANGGLVPPVEVTTPPDDKLTPYQANQKHFVLEAMQNFPEASEYSSLRCVKWRYQGDDTQYVFIDEEEDKRYTVNLGMLMLAADLVLTEVWGCGLSELPDDLFDKDTDYVDDMLCQMDGYDFCALAQIAIFGKVIYG